MFTEALGVDREFRAGAEGLWEGQPSVCAIIRERLRRLRTLERAGVEFHIGFLQLSQDARRTRAKDLYGMAEECGDEAIFRKGYGLLLKICESPEEFPTGAWMELRSEVRACRARFAERMARLTAALPQDLEEAS